MTSHTHQPRRRFRRTAASVIAVAVTVTLAGCAQAGTAEGAWGEAGELSYWMWDSNQMPVYQQCADDFELLHPDITIAIEQYGYDDYWNKLMTSFVANSAPDVFVDHSSKYGDYAERGLIENLDPLINAADIDTTRFVDGTLELWQGRDGNQYGMPKDWDTVAIFYNEDMTTDAGISAADLAAMTWNPTDGGSYEQVIASLTVDTNGVRGNEAGFDKTSVETFGLGLDDSGGGYGQLSWSMLAATTGWTSMDEPTWGSTLNYDDERFQDTIAWWRGLIEKGYMPPLAQTVGASLSTQLQAGSYAMVTDGAWNINTFDKLQGVNLNTAATPAGVDGERASMFNSLADSISVSSTKKAAAWEWVQYLASTDCQQVVAEAGVVFPSISSVGDDAEAAFAETGFDIDAFTTHIDDETTVLFPLSGAAVEINAVMTNAMDRVLSFGLDPSDLTEVNERVNGLLNDY
ncbi:sugar ABC transporter substrate-binding protein [Cryobacterium melibiosiphilum]|uniref:Sugar ABC transporter substrate-binding protein n=1 Tax=Cryobacterium melibiosiphilum TaxID=995039 RepID=A0A3A5ME34_9MICO|nr:sugar ABC transporter substrate-binding protein [Cryobacterium melibiosiphilum]RJT87385.1 sugar ABC transporter substrate-binding protein [Cryobacterium melibiosiphilum]